MNIARIVRALEKAGLKVLKIDCNEHLKLSGRYEGPFWQYICKSDTHKCSFFPNGRNNDNSISESCCSVQVMRKNERNDSQSDYFPGHFCRTIKSIIQSMKGE